jgi:hypothetical protein
MDAQKGEKVLVASPLGMESLQDSSSLDLLRSRSHLVAEAISESQNRPKGLLPRDCCMCSCVVDL